MDLPGAGAILEPVAPALHDRLRRAVLTHATLAQRRRRLPSVVHVGEPAAAPARFVLGDTRLDHALRTDVLEAMVRRVRAPEPLVWLTRAGAPDPQDVDLAWLAAARAASGELGRPLPMVVVTRHGWRDPGTGCARTWARLRR